MTDVPLGFSFDRTDDGFVLRNKTDDGIVTEIKMPAEQVHALKAEIDLWMMSTLQVASGEVQPIVAHCVARVGVWPDALEENVVLIAQGPSGGQMNLSIPLPLADRLVVELSDLLAKMRTAEDPTKQ
jgi:hypothetical protein